MSHVVDIGLPITDLEALEAAAEALGMEVRQKADFKWYGTHVGDYPLPDGFTKEDMGKCKFALGVKGNDKAYEIGVVERRDGQPGYALLWDFYSGGFGLQDAIGEGAGLLKQQYTARMAFKEALRNGYRASMSTDQETGEIRITVRS